MCDSVTSDLKFKNPTQSAKEIRISEDKLKLIGKRLRDASD